MRELGIFQVPNSIQGRELGVFPSPTGYIEGGARAILFLSILPTYFFILSTYFFTLSTYFFISPAYCFILSTNFFISPSYFFIFFTYFLIFSAYFFTSPTYSFIFIKLPYTWAVGLGKIPSLPARGGVAISRFVGYLSKFISHPCFSIGWCVFQRQWFHTWKTPSFQWEVGVFQSRPYWLLTPGLSVRCCAFPHDQFQCVTTNSCLVGIWKISPSHRHWKYPTVCNLLAAVIFPGVTNLTINICTFARCNSKRNNMSPPETTQPYITGCKWITF